MASPTLSDLHSLTGDNIDAFVTRTSPGVYALDGTTASSFIYSYVGRSDVDVNGRLHQWIGKYKYFKFAYSSSAKNAFEDECRLYHDYNPPDNAIHPARPTNSGWACPRCTIFD